MAKTGRDSSAFLLRFLRLGLVIMFCSVIGVTLVTGHKSWLVRGKKGESDSKYRDSGPKTRLGVGIGLVAHRRPRLGLGIGLENLTPLVSVSQVSSRRYPTTYNM